MTLSFPPFTRAVIWLLGINTAIFLLMELLGLTVPGIDRVILENFGLIPNDVVHGWIWQIVTYSFLHAGLWHWFGNMLGIWMFGSALEGAWGSRRFLELYSVGVIGAAITTVIVSYAHVIGGPNTLTIGASGGVFAVLIAFGIVFAENEIMMIPFPFLIKAKYFIGILIVVELAFAMSGGGSVAYVAHLGGLLFGYLYVKFAAHGRGVGKLGLSERYYAVRNSYYRWKRKRAARKFEVYMRDHDRKVTFDEHGNYVPPDDTDKPNGGSKSGWVN
jgi:membrane associated rhomboid family serine protease